MYSAVSATSHRPVAAATGLLFLAVAMHQHIAAGAAPTAGAAVQHVVGGDPGWDVASDVLAWAADTHFAVGDTLWFKHEAAWRRWEAMQERAEAARPRGGVCRLELQLCEPESHRIAPLLPRRRGVEEEDQAAAKAPAPSASSGAPGVAAVAPLPMRRVLLLVFVWCFLLLGV
ncbi:hypothetical protein BRADI_3g53573v3 [Brachypodium distachyon]|uniref:Phytocyanin domain-containing protein n=1 Tax=Brachypodium distachyon TaxID=15368 RepID=A0A0Q3M9N6_BRADI|nr:hypothetical protein BRADI_3g53573v3 [Brachypodium distachyon]